MFKTERILALDIGSSRVVLAEFLTAKAGGAPQLVNYGRVPLGLDPESDADPSAYIVTAMRDIMRERGIKPAPLLLSLSGNAVFPRFAKLPPAAGEKLRQMVQYEAEQNVPFPIEDLLWDYQLVGTTDDGELNIMLVAAKNEHVVRLTDCVQAVGLEPDIVDVGPMAIYNAVRYNYPDLEGCTLVLDIGARSSNMIFFEAGRIFCRSIPVAGNAITQEIMKDFEVSFAEAEQLKCEHAFVAFGGVYAGADNETADRVSKITRNVVTRLHAEVNRSINFYRSQQGGSAPAMLLLAGGSAVIPHMDTFFREKLKVAVEFLNPFVNVPVGPSVSSAAVETDIPVLGEVVGLALRRGLTCPVELNLMPAGLVARKVMRKRQPYFVTAAVGIVLILLCWCGYAYRMTALRERQLQSVKTKIERIQDDQRRLSKATEEKTLVLDRAASLAGLVGRRTQWIAMLQSVRACLLDGMWIVGITPVAERNAETINAVDVAVIGFDDRLRLVEKPKGGGPTAPELFRDRLRRQERFTAETDIFRETPMKIGAYDRQFTVRLVLRAPLENR